MNSCMSERDRRARQRQLAQKVRNTAEAMGIDVGRRAIADIRRNVRRAKASRRLDEQQMGPELREIREIARRLRVPTTIRVRSARVKKTLRQLRRDVRVAQQARAFAEQQGEARGRRAVNRAFLERRNERVVQPRGPMREEFIVPNANVDRFKASLNRLGFNTGTIEQRAKRKFIKQYERYGVQVPGVYSMLIRAARKYLRQRRKPSKSLFLVPTNKYVRISRTNMEGGANSNNSKPMLVRRPQDGRRGRYKSSTRCEYAQKPALLKIAQKKGLYEGMRPDQVKVPEMCKDLTNLARNEQRRAMRRAVRPRRNRN